MTKTPAPAPRLEESPSRIEQLEEALRRCISTLEKYKIGFVYPNGEITECIEQAREVL